MLREIKLVSAATVAVFAIGVQGASAAWLHGPTPLKVNQNPHIDITGSFAFTSPNGGTSCSQTHFTIELTGGTTTGHLRSYAVTNIGTCEVSGALVFLTGGTTTLKSATLTDTATWKPQVHLIQKNEKHHLAATGLTIHCVYENGFSLTLESAATPLTAEIWNSGGPGGQGGAIWYVTVTQSAENKLKTAIGETEVTFHGHVVNPTYGVTAL